MSRVELSLGHRNMTYIRSCNITRDLVWKYNPGGWYEVSSRIVRDITQDSTVHSVIPQDGTLSVTDLGCGHWVPVNPPF